MNSRNWLKNGWRPLNMRACILNIGLILFCMSWPIKLSFRIRHYFWDTLSRKVTQPSKLPYLDLFQSQSQNYVTTDGRSASLLWNKAPIGGLRPDFCYCQTIAGLLMWGLSLTRGRVCRLQLLLALASAVILGSEPAGPGTIFYSLRFGTSFLRLLPLQGYGGNIRPRLHTGVDTFHFICSILLCHNAWTAELCSKRSIAETSIARQRFGNHISEDTLSTVKGQPLLCRKSLDMFRSNR
jgi:hypothetical protein